MPKTATATRPPAADAVQVRRELIGRVRARIPGPVYRTAVGAGLLGTDMRVEVRPQGTAAVAPEDLSEWVDDRIAGALGSRMVRSAAEVAYLEINEAARTGDPAAVRRAVRDAHQRLTAHDAHRALYPTLEAWYGRAPGFAHPVARAAVEEARRAGWDKRPRGYGRKASPV